MGHAEPARLWWVALAVVVGAPGALWALASPVLSVPDEPSHAVTAVALAQTLRWLEEEEFHFQTSIQTYCIHLL